MNSGVYQIKLRRNGQFIVRSGAEQVNGRIMAFVHGWEIGSDSSRIYVGEHAMIPVYKPGEYPYEAPAWIASGDLVAVEHKTPGCTCQQHGLLESITI